MATVVNLNMGGVSPPPPPPPQNVLVLAAPYAAPPGNLLVLRSVPDVAPVTSTMAVAERGDAGDLSAVYHLSPEAVTGTLAARGREDTAAFVAGAAPPVVTGAITVTEGHDPVAVQGSYDGIMVRQGALTVVETGDTAAIAGEYTVVVRAVLAVTERTDSGQFLAYASEPPLNFWNTTERADTFSGTASSVYETTGTAPVQEGADIAALVVRSQQSDEAVSADTLLFADGLGSPTVTADLETVIRFADSLADSLEASSSDPVLVAETLDSGVQVTVLGTDVLGFGDALTAHRSGVSADEWVVGESDIAGQSDRTDETLVFGDALTGITAITAGSGDAVAVSDATGTGRVALSTTSVAVSETPAGALSAFAPTADPVTVSTSLLSALVVTVRSADVIAVADAPITVDFAVSADAVTAAETAASTAVEYGPLADALAWADTESCPIAGTAPPAEDRVGWADGLVGALQIAGVTADSLAWSSLVAEAAITIQVVNAETGAVSTYTVTPEVTGLAEYGGVLYLAGPDGLYALDAALDEGQPVTWSLRTGTTGFGSPMLKRIQDLNVLGVTQSALTFSATAARYGRKQEWRSSVPPLEATGRGNGLIGARFGMSSVDWQFGVTGTGTADIEKMQVAYLELSRRA